MKKSGFSLAELLVTMGIIGVVAALTVPALSNLKPDKDKLFVLKSYKIISDITNEMLNDPSLYMEEYIEWKLGSSYKQTCTSDPSNCHYCKNLSCVQMPINPEYSVYTHSNMAKEFKYLIIFRDKMLDCHGNSVGLCKKYTTTGNLYNFNFYTEDNTRWSIGIKGQDPNESYTVAVARGSSASYCTYDKTSCPKPNQFRFFVNTDGTVSGDDPLTKAYLENPNKLNDKKADYKRAKEINGDN